MLDVFVGTYSQEGLLGGDRGPRGHGEGLYRLGFDERAGTLHAGFVQGGIVNPSYLALSRDGRRLFCVHELDTFQGTAGGGVSAYAVTPDGLARVASQPTHGESPCHVALTPREDLLLAANYGGGSLSALSIDPDGTLGAAQVIRHEGHGPNKARQRAPYVHSCWVTPDGTHAVVADLGTDSLTVYALTGEGVDPAPVGRLQTQPGDGPRICAYDASRNLLFVICELTSQIATFRCDERAVPVSWVGNTSTLPEGADMADSTASDIHIAGDGRFLYASNRGHDSIAVFRIGEDGGLVRVQTVASGGKTPRGFTLTPSGEWLLCGNQQSDTITIFAVDKESGMLTQHGVYAVPTPVCLVCWPYGPIVT